ncbi:beta-glucosidase [Flavivirga eckloniae]|uniref:Beta-glucosidase n=1 Tax=Flavivirga eckloniae TaxID=1803846 RepID=A0A2K9PMQ5_9FLAO|nr:glycoside hydrolase family 3 C-terminal domain-containing protein [Flavivirga eckloniae]AUP78118.1 beta-glucosidase [Flavivirga eckloniae]
MNKTRITNLLILTIFLIGIPFRSIAQYQHKFMDPNLDIEKRLDDLLETLTLDEKITMLSETAPAVERLGIDAYNHGNEALHGIMRPGKFTVFPRPMGLAATFNPDAIQLMADYISDEARGRYNELGRKCVGGRFNGHFNGLLTFWSPNVNMARDPRWGRTGETYGEDPLLTSRMGASFTRGLQGDGKYLKAIATPKHYAANNEEHNRFSCNAEIPERSLREYYLKGFEGCIVDGKAFSIMAAYNSINGVPCSVNPYLLNDILRDEWGFKGYVVGDLNSPHYVYTRHKYTKSQAETAALCIKSGLELDSGFKPFKHLKKAIKKGLCTEEEVTEAARRVLRGRFKLGMFDPIDMVPYNSIKPDIVGSEKHQKLALELAQQSMVLLKNDNFLPLKDDIKKIAVLGPCINMYKHPHYSAYEGSANPPVTPIDGIKSICNEKGIELVEIPWELLSGSSQLVKVESSFLKPEIEIGNKSVGLTGYYYDNKNLEGKPLGKRVDGDIDFDRVKKAPDSYFINEPLSVRWTGKLMPPVSGNYKLSFTYDDGAKVWLNGKEVLNDWVVGASRTKAFDFKMVKDTPVDIRIEYFDTGGGAVAQLKWLIPESTDKNLHLNAIADCDAVIMVMGLDDNHTGEGFDKTYLDLPADQDEMIRKVHALNKEIALVLMNSTALTINWENKNIPAILEAWYPGEKTGTALADILWGKISPSGKLPMTFCNSVDDLPPFDDYDVTNGRTYMYAKAEPLFEFGYGLSYTTFAYSNLKLNKKSYAKNKTIKLSFDVKNTGDFNADEIAQVYIKPVNVKPSIKLPIKQLKGFKRTSITSGASKTIVIEIPVNDINYYNEKEKKFDIIKGEFEIQVGASSKDIRLKEKLVIK